MLGAIFRGIFLIGILTWYSTSVWKMIDSYFKDQFQSYLEEEYRKNPRMKSDVESYSEGKAVPVVTTPRPEATVATLQNIIEACELDACAVEVTENHSVSNHVEKEEVTGGTSENEAARGSPDKNAFFDTATEPGLESRKPADNYEESKRSINHYDHDLEKGKKNEASDQSASRASKNSKKEMKYEQKSATPKVTSKEKQLPKKRKVKTILLTDEDFGSTKRHHVSDDDFWEFEEDAEGKQPLEGTLVSELPFKPRADIGDLERVTGDEYCPLTLEDETSCGETVKWL